MAPTAFRVLDGGVATELSRLGLDLSDELWSARVLLDAPETIARVHEAYFLAGADVAITASYQVSYEGLARRGLDAEATSALLRRSVELARSARSRALSAQSVAGRELLVAASIGPYGAVRHDGSEHLCIGSVYAWSTFNRPIQLLFATASRAAASRAAAPGAAAQRTATASRRLQTQATRWLLLSRGIPGTLCHATRATA